MVVVEPETSKPHVVVLPSPGMGHFIPLLEFAKRLVVHHDIHVSFLQITTEASAAQNQLLHSSTLPPGLDVIDLAPANISALVSEETLVLTRLCIIVRESLRSLKSVLIELGKPQALVIDLFSTQAFEICRELSIPTYTFFTASISFLAFSLYLPTLDREVDCEFVDLPEPIQVPGCTPIRTEDLLDQVRNRKIDEYKWFLLHISRLPMAAGIFLNSWEDLEPTSLKAIKDHIFYRQIPTPPVHPIGPLIKQAEASVTETDAKCLAWLDKQSSDSVLLISLGSGGTLTAAQLTELAWGLELSQQRFILVARKPSDASASGTFFNVGGDINDPTEYLPEGFLERTEGVGLVVPSWVPQVAVLRHPSTGAFLSHCGWNSILESITHGVPMIAWPLYAEQRMNATMLVEDVGVAIKPVAVPGKEIVEREEIERVVRMVMEGEEGKAMRRKARELKDSAVEALRDTTGLSYESLSRVIKEWKLEA
ncbi:Anthocyanidin 3-O-glucosyltransferase 5 [Morella rubra]|uniref:Glycosyltransferase n=1 Tax=Morella rubra TaxID=262757 RepID=A0A6A1W5M1_9ROSI|nr:Anthocyanidin 3-O-glucosyltransferase 5 [Morella rubra]